MKQGTRLNGEIDLSECPLASSYRAPKPPRLESMTPSLLTLLSVEGRYKLFLELW